jgi:hypothetical protein
MQTPFGRQSELHVHRQSRLHRVIGELHYVRDAAGVTVEGDVNGDGVGDIAFDVNGVSSVLSSDFFL